MYFTASFHPDNYIKTHTKCDGMIEVILTDLPGKNKNPRSFYENKEMLFLLILLIFDPHFDRSVVIAAHYWARVSSKQWV